MMDDSNLVSTLRWRCENWNKYFQYVGQGGQMCFPSVYLRKKEEAKKEQPNKQKLFHVVTEVHILNQKVTEESA